MPVVDVVMPARDEAGTVAANVAAAAGCRYVREVVVVDDGSTDDTADRAAAAGAKVVRRDVAHGSKALAMAAGVATSDADAILFVDADCLGLTAEHLDAVCLPYMAGRATMSIGAFDYGPLLNPFVVRLPSLSGERILPREVFAAVPSAQLDGYTIEVRLNDVVARQGGRIVVRTMAGVRHRTKRAKHGRREGYRRTWAMYRDLLALAEPFGDVRWRTYLRYLHGLTVER